MISQPVQRTPLGERTIVDVEEENSLSEDTAESSRKDGEIADDEDETAFKEAHEYVQETSRSHSNNGTNFDTAPEDLDFHVVPPEGGWEEASEDDEDQLFVQEMSTRPSAGRDTQAIFRSQMQMLDLDVAEPAEGWDALAAPPSSPPVLPQNPAAPVLDQAQINAILDRWIDNHVEEGVEMETLEIALKCASLDPELADEALESLLRDGTIPENVKGIWTVKDDACFGAADARDVDSVIRKHGQEALDRRYDFLRNYEAE